MTVSRAEARDVLSAGPAQLLAYFDRFVEAPEAMPRLRRFILDLAVRGRLVEQDPKDEPASEILKKIRDDDAGLRPKATERLEASAARDSALSPRGWQTVRAGELLTFVTSGSRGWAKYYAVDGAIFLRIGNLDYGTTDLDLSDVQRVTPPRGAEGARTLVQAGDILISITGDTGMVALVPASFPEAYINQHIALARPSTHISNRYLAMFFTAPTATADLRGAQRGIKNSLGLEDIRNVCVFLPPLAEQHRIVAKVDELMALCARLEGAQAERERRRDRVVEASLGCLNAPIDASGEYATFHLRHLAKLAARPEHIEQLRRTILTQALRGRLVRQDPNDEPATELLHRVAAERERSIEAGRLKRPLTREVVPARELPFSVPESWEVVRMEWLARKLGAGSTPRGGKSVYQLEGVPFLRSQNVHADGLRLHDVALIPRAVHERMSGTHVEPSDILLNITGASIGRCALVPDDFVEGNVSQHVAIIRLLLPGIREFIHMSLTSPLYQTLIDQVQVGVSREGLSMQLLRRFPMLLPPLPEQHRIIAKVDELMALCDQLEAQLTSAQTERRRLLEAVLHHALADASLGGKRLPQLVLSERLIGRVQGIGQD